MESTRENLPYNNLYTIMINNIYMICTQFLYIENHFHTIRYTSWRACPNLVHKIYYIFIIMSLILYT